MPGRTDAWTGRWVAERLREEDHVAGVEVLTPNLLFVSRPDQKPVVVGTIAVSRVDAAQLRALLDFSPSPDFVVNIRNRDATTDGDAFRMSAERGVPVGGIGDLRSALVLDDVTQYKDKETAYIERGLAQHSAVSGYERLDTLRYRVSRYGMSDVIVLFLNEYDLTADHVRTAREKYGPFAMLVATNPNGRITEVARAAAEAVGCSLHQWRDFFVAIGRS